MKGVVFYTRSSVDVATEPLLRISGESAHCTGQLLIEQHGQRFSPPFIVSVVAAQPRMLQYSIDMEPLPVRAAYDLQFIEDAALHAQDTVQGERAANLLQSTRTLRYEKAMLDKSEQLRRCDELIAALEYATLDQYYDAGVDMKHLDTATRVRQTELLASFNNDDPATAMAFFSGGRLWPNAIVGYLIQAKKPYMDVNIDGVLPDASAPPPLGNRCTHYDRTDVIAAGLIQEINPPATIICNPVDPRSARTSTDYVSIISELFYATSRGMVKELEAYSPWDGFRKQKPSVTARMQQLFAHIQKAKNGKIVQTNDGIRFFPSADAFEALDIPPEQYEDGILLVDDCDQPTFDALSAARIMLQNIESPNSGWTLAINKRAGDDQRAAELLLHSVIQPERYQHISYPDDALPEVVAYGIGKMLQGAARHYKHNLENDLSFSEMPANHPRIYVNDNYGQEMDTYPKKIFPNDVAAMHWLIDCMPLIQQWGEAEKITYTNVGRGPFSFLDLLFAHIADEMELYEPAEPNAQWIEDWIAGRLPKEGDIGYKFEQECVEYGGQRFAGNERRAREIARVVRRGLQGLTPNHTDLAVESFVRCSVSRDLGDQYTNARYHAQSLVPSHHSRMVQLSMRLSKGWVGFPFPSYPVDAPDIVKINSAAGLEVIEQAIFNEGKLDPDDQGIVATISRLKPRFWRD